MPPNAATILRGNATRFRPLLPTAGSPARWLPLDLSAGNKELTPEIFDHTDRFTEWLWQKMAAAGKRFAIGGYNEFRNIYQRSQVFDDAAEPRRLHLGIDVWGAAGTPVAAFMDSVVHSFANNNQQGDYGPTLVLTHQLPGLQFHTLYGHLSKADLQNITIGMPVQAGVVFGHFGEPAENGNWPPHLHFQVILNMESHKGDYPGVCRQSERQEYLANCPDPSIILQPR